MSDEDTKTTPLPDLTTTARHYEIDGAAVEFARLDAYDLAKIDEARKYKAKQQAVANAKETPGVGGALLNDIKNDIDARSYTVGELHQYAQTPQGGTDVLQRSLVKLGRKADEAKALIAKLDSDEVAELATGLLIHKRLYKIEQEAKAEADPADPDAAADRLLAEDCGPNGGAAAAAAPPPSPVAATSPSTEAAATETSPAVVTTATIAQPKGFGD